MQKKTGFLYFKSDITAFENKKIHCFKKDTMYSHCMFDQIYILTDKAIQKSLILIYIFLVSEIF